MATLVVSDLHLGTAAGVDLLQRAQIRAALTARLDDGIDRLVVLGDALELREQPAHRVVAVAEPILAELGAHVAEIVVTAGNHDHALLAGWIDQHLQQEQPMGLEQRIDAAVAGPLAERLAAAARPAALEFAYPGLWLRDDVYAFHGHYLDVHNTVPTIERLAAGTMARMTVPIGAHAAPDDYEAVLAPLYAWIHALAQRSRDGMQKASSRSSVRAWSALSDRRRPVRRLVLTGGLRAAVGVLNRAGIGPLGTDVSGAGLRRGSLDALHEVLARLGVDAPHVIFGHTHRSGPWPDDDPSEWRGLVNTGSWVYQRHFLSERSGSGPYWPGTAVRVDASGPPVLEQLLADRTHAELRPVRA